MRWNNKSTGQKIALRFFREKVELKAHLLGFVALHWGKIFLVYHIHPPLYYNKFKMNNECSLCTKKTQRAY